MEPSDPTDALLRELRQAQAQLHQQMAALDRRLGEVTATLEARAAAQAPPQSAEAVPPALPPARVDGPTEDGTPRPAPEPLESPAAQPEGPRESLELHVGRVWLVRIGVVVVLTGLVLLGNHLYRMYFMPKGPAGKVALLTGLGLAMSLGGWRLMRWREELRAYGRVVMAGGLAALYYTGFAAHFVERLRVIESPVAGGMLLLAMGGALVWLAERLKEERLAVAVALLGFYTGAINPVHVFALASTTVLAAVAVWFLVRRAWIALSWAALAGTYAAFGFWRLHQGGGAVFGTGLEAGEFWVSRGFLLAYWALFTLAAFAGGGRRLPAEMRAGFLAVNTGAFFAYTAPGLHRLVPDGLWIFAAALGGAHLALGRLSQRVAPHDAATPPTLLAQALALLTFALAERLDGASLAVAYALEAAVFTVLAARLPGRRLLYDVATALTLCLCVCQLSLEWDAGRRPSGMVWLTLAGICAASSVAVRLLWHERSMAVPMPRALPWAAGMAVAGGMAACGFVNEGTSSVAVAWACIGTVLLASVSAPATRALECAIASRAWLFLAGWFLLTAPTPPGQEKDWAWLPVCGMVIGGVATWLSWRISLKDEPELPGALAPCVDATLAALAWEAWVMQSVPAPWRPSFTMAAAVAVGVLAARRAGVGASVLAALLLLPPLSLLSLLPDSLNTWRDWSVPAGCLAWWWMVRAHRHRGLAPVLPVAATLSALFLCQRLAVADWLTLVWTGLGLGLFAFGFAVKERLFRLCGLGTVGVALVRLFARDVWKLDAGWRIASFLGLGAGLLVLGYCYNRYRDRLREWL